MKKKVSKSAVILLSGGLDSATVLALAKSEGYQCYAMNINYHQRHSAELKYAKRLASLYKVKEYKVVDIDLSWLTGSSLTNKSMSIPQSASEGIPSTYVPARNTIMMTLALAWAETINSQAIFIGVNAIDYSGYPDCREEYIKSFEAMANLATIMKTKKLKLIKPLEIVSNLKGTGVNPAMTNKTTQAQNPLPKETCSLKAENPSNP